MARQCPSAEHQRRLRNRNPRWFWADNSIKMHRMSGVRVIISRQELYNYALDVDFCEDCGVKLQWGYGHGQNNKSPTVDRRDNNGSMGISNIAIVCRRCNSTKHRKTISIWEETEYGKLRHCAKCGKIKPPSQFPPVDSQHHKRYCYCRNCASKMTQKYHLNNWQKEREYHREYQKRYRQRKREERHKQRGA